jgi:hypothetical protein
MKLIFKYNWCVPYEASGTEIFIIECDSKIKLQVYVLDKIKEVRQKKNNYLTLFNFEFYNLDELEYQIEYNVYTLDEWCEKEIIKIE